MNPPCHHRTVSLNAYQIPSRSTHHTVGRTLMDPPILAFGQREETESKPSGNLTGARVEHVDGKPLSLRFILDERTRNRLSEHGQVTGPITDNEHSHPHTPGKSRRGQFSAAAVENQLADEKRKCLEMENQISDLLVQRDQLAAKLDTETMAHWAYDNRMKELTGECSV